MSVVAVHAPATSSPSLHVEQGRQRVWPESAWNVLPGSHGSQPSGSGAPESEDLPAGQELQWLEAASKYSPVPQRSQDAEPESLWPPLGHTVQAFVAPVLKVLIGHSSSPVCSAFVL